MRLLHRTLLLVCLLGLAAGRAGAQPARALTPDEAVRLGLEHNALLQAAHADAAEARAAYRQARAARWPSISTQASYTRLSGNIPEIAFEPPPGLDFPGLDSAFTLAPVELNRYYSEVSARQPLFTGFRVHNQIRAAARRADAVAFQAEAEAADVAFQIRQAYWRLYQALALRDVAEQALAQVDAFLKDVQNRRAAGAALASDLLAAQARRSEVLLDRVEAANGVRVAGLELNRLAGLPLDAAVEPAVPAETAAGITAEPLPAGVEALVARALEARPAIHALEAQVAAFDAQVDATQGGWLPEVALTGRYVYARPNQYFFTEQDAFKGTWEAGVALSWDLWDGGRRAAETGQARARRAAAEARLASARENVAVEVMRAHLEAQRAAEAVAVADENVVQAEEVFRMVRQQFAEGVVLSAQVLDAELAERTARARRAEARADYAIARAALLNALGQVW